MQLITSICVDSGDDDREVDYPQISHISANRRRHIFWKCATVLFSTLEKSTSGSRTKRIVYTNDNEEVQIGNIDVKAFLSNKLGVEIRYLPFSRFRMTGTTSRTFRNNYYKQEVLCALPKNEEPVILLDTDCVATRAIEPHMAYLFGGVQQVALLEVFRDNGLTDPIAGITKSELASLFRRVSKVPFNEDRIRWYGSEFIAGTAHTLANVGHRCLETLRTFQNATERGLRFQNGTTLLENDEYLFNFIFNQPGYSVADADLIIRRVWTGHDGSPSAELLETPILHLPAEKKAGFQALYETCVTRAEDFQALDARKLPAYLGKVMGIPKREIFHTGTYKERWTRNIIDLVKHAIPLNVWNYCRGFIGRPPISRKWP